MIDSEVYDPNDILGFWYENRKEEGCDCHPKVLNGASIHIGAPETYGCALHCAHYGIADGGKCPCGGIVVK